MVVLCIIYDGDWDVTEARRAMVRPCVELITFYKIHIT